MTFGFFMSGLLFICQDLGVMNLTLSDYKFVPGGLGKETDGYIYTYRNDRIVSSIQGQILFEIKAYFSITDLDI